MRKSSEKLEAKTTTTAVTVKSGDSFNLEDIRVDQDFDKQAGITKRPKKVLVQKPSRQTFYQTFPDKKVWTPVNIIEHEVSREIYLVADKMKTLLSDLCRPALLVPTIDRKATVSIWPLKMPIEGRAPMGWHTSTLEAAEQAQSQWTRMQAGNNAYEISVAPGNLAKPEWPEPFNSEELIRLAFNDRYIDSEDHPVIRRLRGLE
ncbi:MAG: hypothetical protein V7721_03625 [Porticoccaceae bacterium]